MRADYYNNISIGVIAISSVLNHYEELPVSKSFLIIPFITHFDLTRFLANKRTNTKSIEELISQKTSCFSNFNKRYYDSLSLSINAIQYLIDMKYIEHKNGNLKKIKPLNYHKNMGERADKIYKASENIAKILRGTREMLYLNLRIIV
jgi:hypothetical protein